MNETKAVLSLHPASDVTVSSLYYGSPDIHAVFEVKTYR